MPLAARPGLPGVLLLLALAGLLVAGCTEEELPDDGAQAAACQAEVATEAPAPPDVSGDPPADLQVERLAPPPDEACPQVVEGDVVAVHYTGWAWSNGEVFDSSLDRRPITFEVGAGDLIPGWDAGIVGLRVGQRARLVIPPDLAYGEDGAPPAIGGNETLVFDLQVVELLDEPLAPSPTETPTETP